MSNTPARVWYEICAALARGECSFSQKMVFSVLSVGSVAEELPIRYIMMSDVEV
jgi:hypothetical protein